MLFNVCNVKIFLRKDANSVEEYKSGEGDVLSTENESEVRRQELDKTIDGFSLFDDDFMSVVFDRNIEATEFLLNIILERDDMKVIEVIGQREYKNPVIGGRSIRIDIYAKDSKGKIYDIEVQRADEGADVHRARFNSSMIDTRMLKESQGFRELHESYVIFITKNDVMGSGLPLYHIDRVVKETGISFGDGSHIIYVNGSYQNEDDPIGKLVHDFDCTESSDVIYPVLAKQIHYYKETEGGRSIVCKAVDELAEKRRLDAMFDVVKNLMETMKLSVEQAMEAIKLSEEDRVTLLKRF